MGKNNVIVEAVNNFNLYENGSRLIGITSEVNLTELNSITQEVSGTGVLGTYNAAIIGFFEHLSQEIPFRMFGKSVMSLYKQGDPVDLTLRAAKQSTVKATGALDVSGLRLVFRGKAETLAIGTIGQGRQTDSSVTVGLTYILIEDSGEKLLELDKLNEVFIVNGEDQLAKIKQYC